MKITRAQYPNLVQTKGHLQVSIIDQFVLDNVFNRIERDGKIFYWRECAGDQEGYIVIYSDGSHHHTYVNPENWL